MFIDLNPDCIGIRVSSFEELYALASGHGYGGLDFYPEHFASEELARQAGEKLRANGLQWGILHQPCDFFTVDEEKFNEGVRHLGEIMPKTRAGGCTRVYNHIIPGNDTRAYAENFRWHVQRLRTLVDIYGSFGITLGLEFIGPKTKRDGFRHPFVCTLGQLMELVDAVPGAGLVIDCFHLYTSGGAPADLAAIGDGGRVVSVHANDAYPGRTRDAQQDLERGMPLSSGIVDSVGTLRALHAMGFAGPVYCEPFSPAVPRLKSLPAGEAAEEVARAMKELFIRSGLLPQT